MGAGARRPGVDRAHRRKRPRRALPGMLHQARRPSHEWVRRWDLIVTMETDACHADIYSAFFVAEEGTMSSFQGVSEAIRAKGGCSARSTPTAPATTGTRPSAGQAWTRHPDPGRPRPWRKPASVDPGLLARGKGALGSACLAKRLPRNSGSPASSDMVEANRFSSRRSSCHKQRPLRDPRREDRAFAFSRFTRASTTSWASTHSAPSYNPVRTSGGTSASATRAVHRRHYAPGSASRIPRRHNGRLPWTAWRDTTPMANRSTAKPARPRKPVVDRRHRDIGALGDHIGGGNRHEDRRCFRSCDWFPRPLPCTDRNGSVVDSSQTLDYHN